jgi:hypothetical protein
VANFGEPNNQCQVKVSIAHSAGCPVKAIEAFTSFFESYPWVLGIIFILAGPVIALKGKPFVRSVVTAIVFTFATLFMILLFGSFGFMN